MNSEDKTNENEIASTSKTSSDLFLKALLSFSFEQRLNSLEYLENQQIKELHEASELVVKINAKNSNISHDEHDGILEGSFTQRTTNGLTLKRITKEPSNSKDRSLLTTRQTSSSRLNTSTATGRLNTEENTPNKDFTIKNFTSNAKLIKTTRDKSGVGSATQRSVTETSQFEENPKKGMNNFTDRNLEVIREIGVGSNTYRAKNEAKKGNNVGHAGSTANLTQIEEKANFKRSDSKKPKTNQNNITTTAKTPDKRREQTPGKKSNKSLNKINNTASDSSKKQKVSTDRAFTKNSDIGVKRSSTYKSVGKNKSTGNKNDNKDESPVPITPSFNLKNFDGDFTKDKQVNISNLNPETDREKERETLPNNIETVETGETVSVSGKASLTNTSPGKEEDASTANVKGKVEFDLASAFETNYEHIARFFNGEELSTMLLLFNKKFVKLNLHFIAKSLQKEIVVNEEKIKTLREKTKPEELRKPIGLFEKSRGAAKALELLDKSNYSSFFNEAEIPTDRIVILTYKVYFQLIKHKRAISLFDNLPMFWKETCTYFNSPLDPEKKPGTIMNESTKDFDFSNENILKLNKLIGNSVSKLVPGYFGKLCGTTGMVIFLIKDALDYAGLTSEKKNLASRLMSNLHYIFEVTTKKLEKIKSITI